MNMKNKKIVQKFLAQLDSITEPLAEYKISEEIRNFIKENFERNPPENLLWERMAFDFIENYPKDKSEWETYFGPMVVYSDKEGKFVEEYPSIQKLSPEIISYWEKRAKESKHPIFKARYSNLVWDFSEKIKGEKPHYSIAQIFIDSVVEITEKDLHKYEVNVIKKLERALSLALSVNDRRRKQKLIDTIINYEKRIAKDDKPGSWGFSYELLVNNSSLKLDENKILEIIKDLENRFERLLEKADLFAAEIATKSLIDYYSKNGESTKVEQILLRFGELVQKQAEKNSPLVGSAWLEKIYHLYLKYNLKNEANRILNKIRELYKKVKSELKKIETSVKIPEDEINDYINLLTDGELKTVLAKIAINYIPKKDEVLKQLQYISKDAPISFLISHRVMDGDERVIATIGPLEDDIDGHIILQISQNMKVSSIFLRETLNTLIDKFNLGTEEIVNYFYESPIFDVRRKEFFIKGINAFFNEDFLVSLHILIPQIEALIRNLAERIGIPIFKPSRFGGFYYRTLDELLREEAITEVLSEDVCFYLRVLLTDPRGWNLRNDICHGISNPGNFNQITADRIFHALLCLALVKEQERKE